MDHPIEYRAVKDEEKRRLVISALRADPTRSTRLIAKAAGVSQSTAFRIRKELEASGDAVIIATKKAAPPQMSKSKRASEEQYQLLRYELKKDPKRSNRVIAKMVGISSDTVRHMRERMVKAEEIPDVPHKERVNASGHSGNITGAGSRIGIPEDVPLMQMAAKGLLLEEENNSLTIEDVSLLLGVHTTTYRDLRIIKLLSMRDDLTKADAALVQDVIAKLEDIRQVKPVWKTILPLVNKVWGKRVGVNISGPKVEEKRKASFNHAVGLISDMCSRGPEVEIPYLNETEQIAALHKVAEAVSCLKQLSANIRRARG